MPPRTSRAAAKKVAAPKVKKARSDKHKQAKKAARAAAALPVSVAPGRPTKFAVSYVIFHPDDTPVSPSARRILLVQRPADDPNLPNAWGLPAGMHEPSSASLRASKCDQIDASALGGPKSEWEKSLQLSVKQKLGLAGVSVVRETATGCLARGDYDLVMRQWIVEVTAEAKREGIGRLPIASAAEVERRVVVPQPVAGVTQYQRWRWGTRDELLAAANQGSLCSRLFLEYAGAVPKGFYENAIEERGK